MPNKNYIVFPYDATELKKIFMRYARSEVLAGKLHCTYFEEYFRVINAKTVICEEDYIDRDYLDDYSDYYVRCFNKYSRRCTRLHFFKHEFTDQAFEKLLSGENGGLTQKQLIDSYLGFIVVKPLPETIFGRTCLKTYDDDPKRRHFPITRNYEANLFGIPLQVKSIAFQEQDTVVAVCATAALWSVFQATGMLFHHDILSPIEITKAATDHITPETRTLSRDGITLDQLAKAIREVDLEPYIANAYEEYPLQSSVFAYLNAGIPIILGFEIVDTSLPSPKPNSMGNHAVAVTGYSLGRKAPIPWGTAGFLSTASRIDKIYVHDDQIGPFARMVFDSKQVELRRLNTTPGMVNSMLTSWKGKDKVIGSGRAVPLSIIIPLYHKIRIPFETIHHAVSIFDGFIEYLRRNGKITHLDRLEWAIILVTTNKLKTDLHTSKTISNSARFETVTTSMPKYMWRAKAVSNDNEILDFLFDATDIEQGSFFLKAIEYDPKLSIVLREVTKEANALDPYRTDPELMPALKILEWYSEQPV